MFGHIDADAFFASALQRRYPKLRGKPLLALGMGGGCVIAASYEAKAFGVKTGMPLKEARKLCPQAEAVPSDFDEALLASREIERVLEDRCPVMERMSVDEWYLDLDSLVDAKHLNLQTWAVETQQLVKQKTALTVSVGMAPTKLLSKMASEYRKPAGTTLLQNAADVDAFLRDRVAAAIPGVGRKRGLHAERYGWRTAWDIAYADGEPIEKLFGKPGLELQAELRGESLWAVATESAPPKSISRCRSFRGTNQKDLIFSHILDHLTYTVIKMRRHKLSCSLVSVWLRDGEYHHKGGDAKLSQPALNEDQLLPYVRHCFERAWNETPRCTQAGLALLSLKPQPALQYSLFEEPVKLNKTEQRQEALDTLHARYGRDAVQRASALPTRSDRRNRIYTINE